MTAPVAFSPLSAARMQPLVFGIIALLGLSPPAAMAATNWPVTTCDDSGPGSLRAVIGAATTLSGDSVDLSGLACSVISLHTGAITIPQASLLIAGNSSNWITVSGMYNGTVQNDRVFTHTGSGTLSLHYMNVEYGHVQTTTTPALGGCISSQGVAELQFARVRQCKAYSGSGAARGGAIYAYDVDLDAIDEVSFSAAKSTSGLAHGGGVYAKHTVTAKYSTIQNNEAEAPTVKTSSFGNEGGIGGGIASFYNVHLVHATVSYNFASTAAGGISATGGAFGFAGGNPAGYLKLESSTVAANVSGHYVGGIVTGAAKVGLYNSTVANNTAAAGNDGGGTPTFYAVGLSQVNRFPTLTLQSSLIANNTYPGSENDLGTPNKYGVTINAGSANNLVGAVTDSDTKLPVDTIKGTCPKLGQLRNNGGFTKTLALLSHSPAIDHGNNSNNETTDQRGNPYPRVSGTAADIGAYEVDRSDVVFNTDFERCPLL